MSKVVYKTKLFSLERFKDRKLSDTYFYRISGPDSVTIFPLLDDGRIVLERQYRPAIRKYIYELPAGCIDDGETPAHAAARELEEETGYRPGLIRQLFDAYPSPGIRTEFATIYIATNLVKTKTHLDPDEVITIKKVKLEELVEMIKKNQIIDLKTIAAVLFYTTFSAPE
jgi:ADP-ribose pyrophosphatase